MFCQLRDAAPSIIQVLDDLVAILKRTHRDKLRSMPPLPSGMPELDKLNEVGWVLEILPHNTAVETLHESVEFQAAVQHSLCLQACGLLLILCNLLRL